MATAQIGNIPLSAFVLSAEGQCAEDIKLTKGYTFSGKYFTKDNSIADVLNTLLSATQPTETQQIVAVQQRATTKKSNKVKNTLQSNLSLSAS